MDDLKFTTCGDFMKEQEEKYVVVSTVSQFRQRYCIPVSKLQELNTDIDITDNPKFQVEWANDSVTAEEIKEFSQHWMGEQIVDTFILDEERALQLFDRDNEYLSTWTKEKKLEWISDWRENKSDDHTR